jgi:RNA polymerase sigma factor (sigma-70 family)
VALRRRQPDLYRRYQAKEADPEQQALHRLALERAAKIIEGMSARQKTIVLMEWNDHMTEAEIADALGCSKGTIAADVRNIRRRLTDEIGPFYPFDGEGRVSS